MIYVLLRSRTKYEWLEQSLYSVLNQTGSAFKILFVDDASDYTREQKSTIRRLLNHHVAIFNSERKYSLRNAYELIHTYCDDQNGIVINVDGDDFLTSSTAIDRIKHIYETSNCMLSYGECRVLFPYWTLKRFLPSKFVFKFHNTRYPNITESSSSYRLDPIFRPLHPRTWKVNLFNQIKVDDFFDSNGEWLKTCEDQAMFFPMLEMVGGRYFVDTKILYTYRWDHENADFRKWPEQQLQDERCIRHKIKYSRLYE